MAVNQIDKALWNQIHIWPITTPECITKHILIQHIYNLKDSYKDKDNGNLAIGVGCYWF